MTVIKDKSGRCQLILKIDVVQAKNITVKNSNCNPICLVISNDSFAKTKKLKNTTNPRWQQTLKLKLPREPYSENIRILIYDVLTSFLSHVSQSSELTQKKYIYLGEVKLSILELFKKKDTTTIYQFVKSPQWYSLHNEISTTQSSAYVFNGNPTSKRIGEIMLGFRLSVRDKNEILFGTFNRWQTSLLELQKNNQKGIKKTNISKEINYLTEKNEDHIWKDSFANISTDSRNLKEMLEKSFTIKNALECDSKQDEYISTESDEEFTSFLDIVDLKCFDDNTELDLYTMASALDEYQIVKPRKVGKSNNDRIHELTEFFDNEVLSLDDDGFSIDGNESEKHIMMIKKKQRKSSKSFKKHLLQTLFEVSKKKHAIGIVLLDINEILDLPPMKNKFSKKYDMDPFIIISFGRRVFKTSWKKHTLNPKYNERLAFEIYPNETNFQFNFKVVDRDSFSYHDQVADCHISWTQLLKSSRIGEVTSLELPLTLYDSHLYLSYRPKLCLKFKFVPYKILKKQFWEQIIKSITLIDSFDIVQLTLLLDKLGTFTDEEISDFFYYFNKSPWSHDRITVNQVIEHLQDWEKLNAFKRIKTCPLCYRHCENRRNVIKSKLFLENDLVTHFAICQSSNNKKLLKASYVSSDFASKRWFSKLLIKLTYGNYALGSNNANILVQDRDTGIVLEEKISAHVKLGIRIIYNSKGKESKKFKSLLRTLSIKQGKKFDNCTSVKYIDPFIKFHSLDMLEYEETEYKTFNEFFYRKLKYGTRLPESDNPGILLSPADSRCTVFPTIQKSKDIWIKGRQFTLSKLTHNYHLRFFNDKSCSIGIFRLAPQDYHRFHCPCDGIIKRPKYISGEYYTVNPMAVRTELDVFGENVRIVIPIETKIFGTILYIPVGAMMVGSIILTCKEGDKINRGEELGYFKFGGSTVLLIISDKKVIFDKDLIKNSEERIETLVKVGTSIGHAPGIAEHSRTKVVLDDLEKINRIKKIITKCDDEEISHIPWEYHALKNFRNNDFLDGKNLESNNDIEEYDLEEFLNYSSDSNNGSGVEI